MRNVHSESTEPANPAGFLFLTHGNRKVCRSIVQDIEQLLKSVGEVLAIYGGAGVVGFVLFQYLGKKWIEKKFAEKLSDYTHLQNVELQRLRVEIDSLLSDR